ncbi:hypothetical protein CEXT_500971 [Caerostris extrusa]|uniref:Uncharacterized protein n=1 Tax=Caerostris extrusa TaxID=172846 RepID=A0AAV4M9F3_CAEEX|nr:hypothetical protein CEXT_500971 [Caerostris extrusa]
MEVSRNSKVEEFLWSALLNNDRVCWDGPSLVLLGDSAKMDGGNKVSHQGLFVVGALFKEEICFCSDLINRLIREVSRNSKVEEFLWSALAQQCPSLLGWSSLLLLEIVPRWTVEIKFSSEVFCGGCFV